MPTCSRFSNRSLIFMKVDGCPHASEVCSYAELERQTHNALQYSRAFNAVAGVVAAYGTAEDPRLCGEGRPPFMSEHAPVYHRHRAAFSFAE